MSAIRRDCARSRTPAVSGVPLTFRPSLMKTRIAILASAVALAACSSPAPTPAPQPAQNRPTGPTNPAGPPAGVGQPGQGADTTGRAGLPAAPQPRPYNRVITADAKTRRGLFAVHRVGDRLYFEI